MRKIKREETIRANEWEERRFQQRVEVGGGGGERMKPLLKGASEIYTYH